MEQPIFTLRKLIEALNCVNESEVYIINYNIHSFTIYKYRNEAFTGDKSDNSYMKATTYLVNELHSYLKRGGMIEC